MHLNLHFTNSTSMSSLFTNTSHILVCRTRFYYNKFFLLRLYTQIPKKKVLSNIMVNFLVIQGVIQGVLVLSLCKDTRHEMVRVFRHMLVRRQ